MRALAEKPKTIQQSSSTKTTVPGWGHLGQSREVSSIHPIQRTVGKPAVPRMPQTDADEPKAELTRTTSARYGNNFGLIPIHPLATGAMQTKLANNKPGDSYEQEADRVSDTIMRLPDARVSLAVREDDDVEEQQVQSKGTQTAIPKVTTAVADNIRAMNGGGSALPDTSRAFFEPRFGADFSQVRVHTDSRAAETANSIDARAFTVGSNIAFGAGQYAPESREGRQLMAHELTHVVQQNSKKAGLNFLSIQRAEWFDQARAVGPYDMVQAGLAANEARFEAEHSGLPGFSDGPQDAFRHAYWSCLLALDIGADQAKEVGDIHEDQAEGVSPMITLMDQHNNAIGRLLAQQVKKRSDVKALVWGALRRGNLLIIENWKARADARRAGQKPIPAAGRTVMSNIDPDDLDTSIKPLPTATLDWVKSKTDYRIAREKEMVALLRKPISAGDLKAHWARNKELLEVTKNAADLYWSGYYRDRFEASRADDELVTLLRRRLSRHLAGQIKDILTYADAGKKDKPKKKKALCRVTLPDLY